MLGPFPIHAREQHFLSPAYPLDRESVRSPVGLGPHPSHPVSLPVDTTAQYPTSLTHSANASWSQTTADPHGVIHVSHPSVPWSQIRATEGWAGLQHLNVLRGWMSLRPPSDLGGDTSEPLLRTQLLQGAFFTILPPPDSPERETHVPEWHRGNIYALERAPVQLISLPCSPTSNDETRYEVIICAPYEVHLPLFSQSSPELMVRTVRFLRYAFLATPLHTSPRLSETWRVLSFSCPLLLSQHSLRITIFATWSARCSTSPLNRLTTALHS